MGNKRDIRAQILNDKKLKGVDEATDRLVILKDKIADATGELETFDTQLAAKRLELDSMDKKIEEAKSEATLEAAKALAEINEKIVLREKVLADLRQQNDDRTAALIQRALDLQTSEDVNAAEANRLQVQADGLNAKEVALNKQQEALVTKANELAGEETRLDELDGNMSQRLKEILEAQRALDNDLALKQKLIEDFGTKKAEVEELQKALKEKTDAFTVIEGREAGLNSRQADIERREQQNIDDRDALQEVDNRMQAYKVSLDRLKREIDNRHQLVKKAEEELAAKIAALPKPAEPEVKPTEENTGGPTDGSQ